MTAAAPFRAALERRAAVTPEEPFLFFRGERGHFRWWSFARAAACLAGDPAAAAARAGEAEAAALLTAAEGAEPALAAALADRLAAAPERDVWISYRPPTLPSELALALFCAESGAAVLREPGDRLHPELFAWARPTLVSAEFAALARLFDDFALLAPRLGGERWRRRRLARLRAVMVEGGGIEPLVPRLAALGAGAGLRVVGFPAAGEGRRIDEGGPGG